MPLWLEIFSVLSPFKYAFNNYARVELENNPEPITDSMLQFLDIQESYWQGVMYLGIFIVVVQICSVSCLKCLVGRFQ